MSRSALDITRLFDRYVDAKEAGRNPQREELIRQAGPYADELLARIEVFESLEGIGEDLRGDGKLHGSLGNYELLSPIGEGGLGVVYLAYDPELDRKVALKVLGRESIGRRERDWALNEARALARLQHPGVVEVFSVEAADGRDFIVMEYLPGPSLAEVIGELRRLKDGQLQERASTESVELAQKYEPYTARIECLERLAQALAYCHDRGVLHRDIKPSNILFDGEGFPRLIDFGLAHRADADSKIDITRRLVGTPAYIAPEQVSNQRTGAEARSDQFSFGTLSYELLCLENPFQGESHTTTLAAVERAEPRRLRSVAPAVSRDLGRIVRHCLARDPARRYPDMDAVAADLRAVLDHRPVAIQDPSIAYALRLWVSRERRRITLVAAALSVALSLVLAQRVSSAFTAHSALDEELSALDVDALQSPADFRRSYTQLQRLSVRAGELDRSQIASWVGGSASRQVQALIESWSERVAAVLDVKQSESLQKGVSFQSTEWSRIVALEIELCPTCDNTREYRDRGRIRVPLEQLDGLEPRLFQLTPPGPVHLKHVLLPHPIDLIEYPAPGAYRLLLEDRQRPGVVVREREFAVTSAWAPARDLPLPPRRPEILARTVRVPAGVQQLENKPHAPIPLPTPPFLILDEPVSCDDIRLFLRSTRGEVDDSVFLARRTEDPAWVSYALAREYAAWVGGRLPSAQELFQAKTTGAIQVPTIGPQGTGEWVGCHSPVPTKDTMAYTNYEQWAACRSAFQCAASMEFPAPPSMELPTGETVYLGFRVVFSIEVPR